MAVTLVECPFKPHGSYCQHPDCVSQEETGIPLDCMAQLQDLAEDFLRAEQILVVDADPEALCDIQAEIEETITSLDLNAHQFCTALRHRINILRSSSKPSAPILLLS